MFPVSRSILQFPLSHVYETSGWVTTKSVFNIRLIAYVDSSNMIICTYQSSLYFVPEGPSTVSQIHQCNSRKISPKIPLPRVPVCVTWAESVRIRVNSAF